MINTKNFLSSLFWGKNNEIKQQEVIRQEINSINLLRFKQREKKEKKTCDTLKKMQDTLEKRRSFEELVGYYDWQKLVQLYNPNNELIQNKFI